MPLFVRRVIFPSFRNPQQVPKDPSVADKTKSKIKKVRCRSYISDGQVLSLTSYFRVPKVDLYIRVFNDFTACGLNTDLWDPSFWMPNVHKVLYCATHISLFGNVDAG